MKSVKALLFVLAFSFTLLAGCTATPEAPVDTPTDDPVVEVEVEAEEVEVVEDEVVEDEVVEEEAMEAGDTATEEESSADEA